MLTMRHKVFQYSISFLSVFLGILFFTLFDLEYPDSMTYLLGMSSLIFLSSLMEFEIFNHRHSLINFVAIPLIIFSPNPPFILTVLFPILFAKNTFLKSGKLLDALNITLHESLAYLLTAAYADLMLSLENSLMTQILPLCMTLGFYGLIRMVFQIPIAQEWHKAVLMGVLRFIELGIIIPMLLFIWVLTDYVGLDSVLWILVPVLTIGLVIKIVTEFEKRRDEIFRRKRELQVLQEVSNLSMRGEVGQSFFDEYGKLLNMIVPIESAAVIFWESFETDRPIQVFALGEVERGIADLVNLVENLKLYERGPDMMEITNLSNRFWLHHSRKSRAIFPLKTQELYMGLLVLESTTKALEKLSIIDIFSMLSDHLSVSIQDYMLRKEMQLMNERLMIQTETFTNILEISYEITSELQLDQVLNKVANAVKSSLGFNSVLLSFYNSDTAMFERRAQAGLDDIWEKVKNVHVPREEVTKFWTERFRISKSYFVEHTEYIGSDYDIVSQDVNHDWKPGMWHPLNMLFIPLQTDRDLIGYLSIDDPLDGKIPSYEKIQALEIFANQAVAAIISARNYEKIKLLSILDPLTDTYNHRHFQEVLQTEIVRHKRMKKPFTLAMIDIDHFKEINDSFGHLAGDEILRSMIKVIRHNIRDVLDPIFRYGGEEFTIIFSELPLEKSVIVAERIRKAIEEHPFQVVVDGEEHSLHITISVGLSMFPDNARVKDQLIDRADQALYRAKARGKNCVVMYSFSPDGSDEKQRGLSGS